MLTQSSTCFFKYMERQMCFYLLVYLRHLYPQLMGMIQVPETQSTWTMWMAVTTALLGLHDKAPGIRQQSQILNPITPMCKIGVLTTREDGPSLQRILRSSFIWRAGMRNFFLTEVLLWIRDRHFAVFWINSQVSRETRRDLFKPVLKIHH